MKDDLNFMANIERRRQKEMDKILKDTWEVLHDNDLLNENGLREYIKYLKIKK